jgi:superfamily II DNA or RNA helicase
MVGCVKLNCAVQKKEIYKIHRADAESISEQFIFDCAYKLCDQLKQGFVREPHQVEIDLDFSLSDYIDNNKIDGTVAKITALKRRLVNGLFSVTIMLVNDHKGRAYGTNCIHQPVVSISTVKNEFTFRQYSNLGEFANVDEEEKSLALLYQDKKIYGSGLGTSVQWEIDKNGRGLLFSEFFPQAEVPALDFSMLPKYKVSANALSMKYLSDLDNSDSSEKIAAMHTVIGAYGQWINELKKDVSDLASKYHIQADKNIQKCNDALNRMYAGIKTLANDVIAWESFELANRAMFMEREQLKIQEKTSHKERFPNDVELSQILNITNYAKSEDNHHWRPFQLAFILLSVNSIVNEKNNNGEERDWVDLIWFPTGGGKTEAYLGLTAFTIFFRRLYHASESSGTTVIMRYTLRLLATQQFTRAATLICACEYIRRDSNSRHPHYKKYELGEEAITIGLWIGGTHTPNKNYDAKEKLSKLLQSTVSNIKINKDRYNKFQVLKCPWCGTKMVKEKQGNHLVGQWGYKMRNNSHFYMSCPQESCSFYDKLPIQIVDEELYIDPPTLLFGTVDKFAMLPWKKEIGSFFATQTNNRTPELIVQDELHLISGPLGTMVGLYETAVDALCSAKGIRPKIIASTATIRRAEEQCSVLYNRKVVQFPPSGLNSDDSFFARESTISYKDKVFGRKYIGLMPSGKTKAMMEVRTIAALLQKINLMNLQDELKDKLWTLTVYFNSLRDLGKCSTLVDDDVKDFIKRMAYRLGTAKDARLIGKADELTSRVSTTELNETLDKLEKLSYSKENIANKMYASNALLATNMISVGIDVARLNIMLLVGQPKLTSEYIQASSRIGRFYPGVAFSLYDGSKSRDRSHYEQFKAYHDSFYRYVEPTGATPFSKPARDRALHAIVVTIMRHIAENLLEESDAANFKKVSFEKQIENVKGYIINRVQQITSRSNSTVEDDSGIITEEIDEFFDQWERLTTVYDKKNFFYGEKFMIKYPETTQGRLLKQFNTAPNDTAAIDTLTSMRNVDSMVSSNILVWEE